MRRVLPWAPSIREEGRPVGDLVAAEAMREAETAIEAAQERGAVRAADLLGNPSRKTGARESRAAVSPRLRPMGRAI